jgi:nucleoside-diphosphate-sugar epimerase
LENHGRGSRDFIYVGDVVRGLVACAEHGSPGQAYNLASGVETEIRDLAESINRLTDNRGGLEFRGARDWDRSGRRFGSTDKSEAEIGFRASTTVEAGLRRTVEWMRGNRQMIARTIQRHEPEMLKMQQ